MKFLLWSNEGDGLGLIDRLKSEGHDVILYLKDDTPNIYKGLVKKIKNPEDALSQDRIILFDMAKSGEEADNLRKRGFKVLGASKFQDKLELDRTFGLFTMKRVSLSSGEIHEYNSLSECEKGLQSLQDKGWVLKPLDNLDTSLTYKAPDKDHMFLYLEYLKKHRGIKNNTRVILQEAFSGIEISSEVWFINGKPIWGLANHTFETKKFMNADLGPNTGCSSSLVFPAEGDLIHKIFTPRLLRILEEHQYCGPLDINCIIEEDGTIHGLEFTPRFGYNAIYAFLELLPIEFGELCYKLVTEKGNLRIDLSKEFAYCVRVTIPPYPFRPTDKSVGKKLYAETAGIPIGTIPAGHCYLLDVMDNGDHTLVTSGYDGVVMEVVDKGKSIDAAKDRVNNHLRKLTLTDRQYRTDGWEVALKRYKQLFDRGK